MTKLPPTSDAAYQSAIEWLMGRINYERFPGLPYGQRVLKLDRMQLLVGRLGDPQLAYPIVHVAGTKGKGSTAAMIAAMLREAGFRVGLYTSPHLDCIEQRLVVDQQQATAAEMIQLIDLVRPVAERLDSEFAGRDEAGPTFFDIVTALAMLHFRRRAVDVAVLEVGLGGRLDSTNVVHPAVSVITSISFDHTKQLGNTLAAIAREKAGIIKPGVPVVSGVVDPEPRTVIEETARQRAARLWQLDRDFWFDILPSNERHGGEAMLYRSNLPDCPGTIGDIRLGLPGEHQAMNAAAALATVDELCRQGWRIDKASRRRGLTNVRLPARIELLPGPRPIVVDVAHNPASAEALVNTLGDRWPKPWTLVAACSKDKDVPGIVGHWVDQFDRVIATRYVDNPRAVDPDQLADMWRERGHTRVEVRPDPCDALRHALATTPDQQLVVVSGSFFIAAELRGVALAIQAHFAPRQ